MNASIDALSLERVMTIREIAKRWGAELGCAWLDLEAELIDAGLKGMFDGLHDAASGHGLLTADEGVPYSTKGSLIREEMRKLADSGVSTRAFLLHARENEWFALHPDGVRLFAECRGLSRPSWLRGQGAAPEAKRTLRDATYRTGLPGKPSSFHLVEGEFRRRAERGDQHPTLVKEAEHLAAWLKSEHPAGAPCTAKVIRNRLAEAFRKAKRSPDIK
ncbi:hypothetical protein SAMN05519103_04562 [Rhizobiales bacterium GAS113]|nr:hypothetical protein SAMN05519103_04562 [Rhizobiales bacterium GAS113]